ncbi:MAG: UDP-3-O-acyl-N-acetylglucosamine deacetylase [Myxococcota bacterium]
MTHIHSPLPAQRGEGSGEGGAQHTLARAFSVRGTALHAGGECGVEVRPAPPDAGRVFVVGGVRVPAALGNVVDTRLATTLGVGDTRVRMVEHLCAALFAEGVDNVEIEVEGGEVPVLDGSARLWTAAIRNAGLAPQGAPRRVVAIAEPVRVEVDGAWAMLLPAARFELDVAVDFTHPRIGAQRWIGAVGDFSRELAWARTFGFFRDAHALWASGLARGASLENTVVYDEAGVMNPDGLRAADEAVRHKALDAIGDAALLGAEIRGRLVVHRAGHGVHRRLWEAVAGA